MNFEVVAIDMSFDTASNLLPLPLEDESWTCLNVVLKIAGDLLVGCTRLVVSYRRKLAGRSEPKIKQVGVLAEKQPQPTDR